MLERGRLRIAVAPPLATGDRLRAYTDVLLKGLVVACGPRASVCVRRVAHPSWKRGTRRWGKGYPARVRNGRFVPVLTKHKRIIRAKLKWLIELAEGGKGGKGQAQRQQADLMFRPSLRPHAADESSRG